MLKKAAVKKIRSAVGEHEIQNSLHRMNDELNKQSLNLQAQIQNLEQSLKKTQDDLLYCINLLKVTHDISKSPYKGGQTKLLMDGNIKLLLTITKFMQENNIDYYLDYGTLLGVIRHGGIIPWDNDIDISVTRQNYNKLLQLIPEAFKDTPIHIVHSEIIRIFYGQTPLQIDIFPLDFYNKKLSEMEKQNLDKKLQKYQAHIIYDWDKLLVNERVIVQPSYHQMQELRRKLCPDTTFEQAQKGKYTIMRNIDSPSSLTHCIDFDIIYPLRKVSFVGQTLLIPNRPDLLLTIYYGDYWEYPRDIVSRHGDIIKRINPKSLNDVQEFLQNGISLTNKEKGEK